MNVAVGSTVGGHYRLDRQVSGVGVQPAAFEATDRDGYRYLVKLWPFAPEGPDPIQRALWDQELAPSTGSAPRPAQSSMCFVSRTRPSIG